MIKTKDRYKAKVEELLQYTKRKISGIKSTVSYQP